MHNIVLNRLLMIEKNIDIKQALGKFCYFPHFKKKYEKIRKKIKAVT